MRILMFMVMLFCFYLPISADDELIDTIYYVPWVNQTIDELVPFRSALASRGYTFKRFDIDMSSNNIVGFLGDIADDGSYNFRLLTDRSLFIEDLSPLLYSRYDDPILRDTVAELNGIQSPQLLADYLDFTVSYINGDCATVTAIGSKVNPSSLQPLSTSFVEFAIGNCLLYTSDIDSAALHLTKSVEILNKADIDQPFVIMASHANLVWAYIQLGDTEPARERLNQLIELSQDFSPTLQAHTLEIRAQMLALMFDYTSAIQDMDIVIELLQSDYGRARAYKQRGDIIMLIYEWNRALDDYNMAIELNSNYAEAYYRRGILYYTMVERANAIADFETYLELASEGEFAESAQQYIDDIQIELDALGG